MDDLLYRIDCSTDGNAVGAPGSAGQIVTQ
jgi:hypothetical protein